ncbi:MAG: transposase [Armatimonadetes bacterium]|nr:transposase [Armatimonadota bacterium]
MRATLRLKLHTDERTANALRDTLEGFTACFNAATDYGWTHDERNSLRLHRATYTGLRETHPSLPSQRVCASRIKAVEALKSVDARKAKGKKVGCPISALCPVRYDTRSYGVRLQDECASLATTQGRVCLTFSLPVYYRRYLTWHTTSADLCFDPHKRRFYLHVVMEKDTPTVSPNGDVVGCDLGVRRIAVTSKPQFFSSSALHRKARRHQHLRSALQRKGTKSAKRHLRRLGRAWYRFTREQNHLIANAILDALPEGAALTVEDLTDIRERCQHRKGQRGLFHRWSFAQLQAFLAYKAQQHGIVFVRLDPRHTSRQCPKCGHTEKANRKRQGVFHCVGCGYEANADFVAACNLRQKGRSLLARLLSESPSCPTTSGSSEPGRR